MNLLDLIERKIPPDPWAEGEKIPWNDPAFSERMLHEHLSQEHNAASRRSKIIDQHVNWIHSDLLGGLKAKILDLGCGPGLYTSRFAELGHSCVGIDYAPASIAYAKKRAAEAGLDCTYIEADVRDASFEHGNSLVMMIHGEINVFRPKETRAILNKARESLASGGRLLLEVHTLPAVRGLGEQEPRWFANAEDLFSEQPHLYLKEAFWDEDQLVTTERFYIIDARSGDVTAHAASIQGYEEAGYLDLLKSCGFNNIQVVPSLGGVKGEKDKNYVVYVARQDQLFESVV